jgi:hypothetical protein
VIPVPMATVNHEGPKLTTILLHPPRFLSYLLSSISCGNVLEPEYVTSLESMSGRFSGGVERVMMRKKEGIEKSSEPVVSNSMVLLRLRYSRKHNQFYLNKHCEK